MKTELEEIVNGWLVVLTYGNLVRKYYYEKYDDAKSYRDDLELNYVVETIQNYKGETL